MVFAMWTRRLGTKGDRRGREVHRRVFSKTRSTSGREASGQVKSSQVKLCTRVDWPSGLLGGQPTERSSLLVGGADSALRQRIQAKPQHAARRYMY